MFNTGVWAFLGCLEVCLDTKIHVSCVFCGITAWYCNEAMSEHWGLGDGWGGTGGLFVGIKT